jgi:hypothetical protein
MSDDRTSPATKGDLQDLKQELLETIRSSNERLKDELLVAVHSGDQSLRVDLQALKDDLIEVIRDSQTETLHAFYGFTQTVQDRFKEADQTEAALKRRIGMLKSRSLDIEKRLNIPPAAA